MEKTLHIRVYGIVQAVGFRPFVSRMALSLHLRGSVANKGSFVEIFLQGEEGAKKRFLAQLENDPPVRASILRMDLKEMEKEKADSFEIIESEKEMGDIFVSPDIATCPACKKELYDSSDFRYLHPFINCTSCGPRLTILEGMPYDRERTAMKEFPMCEKCHKEYISPETRRYDAQPVCCNDCGPQIYILGREEKALDAIVFARKSIMEGKIIAIKGIGGFHLCCDGRNEKAVAELRKRKFRPHKPFALMMPDLETVRKECVTTPLQEKILDGHQKPIILLKKRPESTLPDILAPGNPTLGVMLPYAPLQMLLFDCGKEKNKETGAFTDVLVMTSGNVSGAPICRNDEDALKEIGSFCDLILSHNRKILLRADDSVIDIFEEKPYMIRRSRGYAPLPFILSGEWKGNVLGIGGELKNTFCMGKDSLFYPSSYIGDMGDIRSTEALKESIKRMGELLECTPQMVCCDLHPKYNSVMAAQEMGLPLLQIQHHYAHILSCMAENDFLSPVIGVSFDGTGYGTDGTIWGGEILQCSPDGFERLGHIAPFRQVGGDMSAKEGWRIASSLLYSLYGEEGGQKAVALGLCTHKEYKMISLMADKMLNTVLSTSCGRLFDAASALLGLSRNSSFEGKAAMDLQFAALKYAGQMDEEKDCNIIEQSGKIVMDTFTLFRHITEKVLNGERKEKIAWEFHKNLASLIVKGCIRAREKTHLDVCALSGGVFQNTLLLQMCKTELEKHSFKVLCHSLTAPNDGGIALGQAVAAMNFIHKK